MNTPKQISRQNHYVPEWYQEGFRRGGLFNFFLDLAPPLRRPDGTPVERVPRRRPPGSCFWEQDLYITRFGEHFNDQVETILFAGIDDFGARAVRAFVGGEFAQMHQNYEPFFSYLGAQKLRTPKGLDWIRRHYPALSQVELMVELQHLRHLYGTVWAEAVREIVSAEDSDVKFLVTDHPVTTFNAAWPWDAGLYDPPVALNGTQTVFALDANHCLILTHLPYAQAPEYVSLTSKRENARSFAQTLIRTDAMVRSRRLTSDEVIAINHLLKAKALRYIAAAEFEELYPERHIAVDPTRVARVLLPPHDQLWHFGGEVYIGYNDGRVDYRDALGRSSRAHELLAKPLPQTPPAAEDECPCGNGATFGSCCEPIPSRDRPPWDVMSLRERNLTFIRTVASILRLSDDWSWDDVRRNVSDTQIAEIHEVVRGLWPEGTDLAALLPRPNDRLVRAVYMGPSDPRTVACSVIGLVPLFDQLLVIDPFLHPAGLRPEYSPVDAPGTHKQQLLKNVLFVLTIEPLIRAGKLLLFPDPGNVAPQFRHAMTTMAQQRTADWRLKEADFRDLEWLARDDFQRSLSQLPDDALRAYTRQVPPNLSDNDLDVYVAGMRDLQKRDPLALLQPLPSGEAGSQFSTIVSTNLEVALFIAQLTGAMVVTDLNPLWEHIHLHTRAVDGSATNDLRNVAAPLAFRAHVHPVDVLAVSKTAPAAAARAALQRIYQTARAAESHNEVGGLIAAFQQCLREVPTLTGEGVTAPGAVDDMALSFSIPEKGFASPTVQRLVVGFGREDAAVSIPLALFRSGKKGGSHCP